MVSFLAMYDEPPIVTTPCLGTISPVCHLSIEVMLSPLSPLILIGVPHVPSLADEATFCDIHIAPLVAYVCQPPVVPFPVGTEGWEVLSL